MSEFIQNNLTREERINMMKDLLIDMDKGLITPQEVKERFGKILANVHPAEIAIIENILITQYHFPQEKIHRLCDVHIDIFRESLDKENLDLPKEHPLNIFLSEHKNISQILKKLLDLAKNIEELDPSQIPQILKENVSLFELVFDIENHMVREENALFPFLEKHDVIQAPQILWKEHDTLRERFKEVRSYLSKGTAFTLDDRKNLSTLLKYIVDLKVSHIFKENKILFPTAIDKLTQEEWESVLESMFDIGFAKYTDQELIQKRNYIEKNEFTSGYVNLKTGKFKFEELEAMFETLPLEITFIDKDDIVQFFNRGDKRVFVRTKAVLGRTVQNCHPPKSVHIVNKILNDFKSGKRSSVDFWINHNDRLIYIRYFAIRDENGNYLGALEVTQDVTEIKKLEGEKRIYSEE